MPDNGNQMQTKTKTTAAAQPQHALAPRKKHLSLLSTTKIRPWVF
jgi:hypothetical protein